MPRRRLNDMPHEDIEALWITAWDQLLGLSRDSRGFRCMLPDGTVVSVEDGLGWLQEAVYAGYDVSVSPEYLFGSPGALLQCHKRGG